MTKDELIEVITKTLVGDDMDADHLAFCHNMGVDVLAAIEAQGMAIVPVEATDAMLMAGADYSCYGDIAKAYDYMIEAGKL